MGKFIDKIKDALDFAADTLNEKAEDLMDDLDMDNDSFICIGEPDENCNEERGFDIDAACKGLNFDWRSIHEKVDPKYNEMAQKYTASAEKMMYNFIKKKKETECITLSDSERAEINRKETMENSCKDPIALDVFGNYIYLGDEVMKVDYNDRRNDYISIKRNFKTYAYCDVNGAIQRNVLLKKKFDELMRSGNVSLCEKTGFYHVTFGNRLK